MFAGYDQVAPFIVSSDDPWEKLEAQTAKMVSEIPADCRPLVLDDEGLGEEFQERLFDFAMLVEFCELVGPTVLLTCPKVDPNSAPDAKFLSDLCLKMMATDFQHCSRPAGSFHIASDSSLIFYDALLACYCAYFTLYDIEARGYVRSFCLAFVARSCSNLDQTLLAIEGMFESVLYQLHQQNMRQFYRAVLCKWRSLSLMERLKRSDQLEEPVYAPAELLILESTSDLDIALALEQVHDILEECRRSPWYIDELIDYDDPNDWCNCSRPPIINVKAPKIVEGRTLKPWFVIAGVSEADFGTEVDCGLADVKQQLLNFNFYDDCSRPPLTFSLLAPSIGAVRSNYGLENDLIAATVAPVACQSESSSSSPLADRFVQSLMLSLDLTEMTFGEFMGSPAGNEGLNTSVFDFKSLVSDAKTAAFARSLSCQSSEDLPAPAHLDFRTSSAMLLAPLFVDTFAMLPAMPALMRMFAANPNTVIHLCAATLAGMHVLVVAEQQGDVEPIVAWLSLFLLRHQSAHVNWLREEATKGPRPRAFKRQSVLGVSAKVKKMLPEAISKFAVVYEVATNRYEGNRYAKGGLLWQILPRRHNALAPTPVATACSILEVLFAFLRRAFRAMAMARGQQVARSVPLPPVGRGSKITDEKIVSSLAARVSESFVEERLPRIV